MNNSTQGCKKNKILLIHWERAIDAWERTIGSLPPVAHGPPIASGSLPALRVAGDAHSSSSNKAETFWSSDTDDQLSCSLWQRKHCWPNCGGHSQTWVVAHKWMILIGPKFNWHLLSPSCCWHAQLLVLLSLSNFPTYKVATDFAGHNVCLAGAWLHALWGPAKRNYFLFVSRALTSETIETIYYKSVTLCCSAWASLFCSVWGVAVGTCWSRVGAVN